MKKREPLMSDTYFVNYLSQSDEFIEQIARDLTLPPGEVYVDAVYHNLYTENFNKITAQYSAGCEVDELTISFKNCLLALFNYKKQAEADKIFFIKEVDEYMNALALLTWGITLNIEQPLFDELVGYVDAEGERDALVDLLISFRHPARFKSEKLYFPKLYIPLYEAITRRSPQQIGLFLSRWYTTCLSKTAHYDIHTLHGGEDSGFTGYWAWEVAGLTYALGIDDNQYCDMRYYPADLIAFHRQ